jgi:hypothetical protein
MIQRPGPTMLDLPASSQPLPALTYVSARGVTWHLHQGVTPKGKARYFVSRTLGVGALAAMPAGWEFRESVNGVVSVARIDPAAHVAPADLAALQAEVARHRHLARYKVFDVKGTLVLHEPIGVDPENLSALASALGCDAALLSPLPSWQARYKPVLKFESVASQGSWRAFRYVYSGMGSWRQLGRGALAKLAQRYVPAVGTEAYFELY